MLTTAVNPDLEWRVEAIFGDPEDEMPALEQRSKELIEDTGVIVWEGDAATFQFLYVSESAASILGYPVSRWIQDPTFWTDTILHPEDRNDAIAYCALATGKRADHDFVYRAVRSDGSIVWLHDVVKVVLGEKGFPVRLRGVMIPLTAEREGLSGIDFSASDPDSLLQA